MTFELSENAWGKIEAWINIIKENFTKQQAMFKSQKENTEMTSWLFAYEWMSKHYEELSKKLPKQSTYVKTSMVQTSLNHKKSKLFI